MVLKMFDTLGLSEDCLASVSAGPSLTRHGLSRGARPHPDLGPASRGPLRHGPFYAPPSRRRSSSKSRGPHPFACLGLGLGFGLGLG